MGAAAVSPPKPFIKQNPYYKKEPIPETIQNPQGDRLICKGILDHPKKSAIQHMQIWQNYIITTHKSEELILWKWPDVESKTAESAEHYVIQKIACGYIKAIDNFLWIGSPGKTHSTLMFTENPLQFEDADTTIRKIEFNHIIFDVAKFDNQHYVSMSSTLGGFELGIFDTISFPSLLPTLESSLPNSTDHLNWQRDMNAPQPKNNLFQEIIQMHSLNVLGQSCITNFQGNIMLYSKRKNIFDVTQTSNNLLAFGGIPSMKSETPVLKCTGSFISSFSVDNLGLFFLVKAKSVLGIAMSKDLSPEEFIELFPAQDQQGKCPFESGDDELLCGTYWHPYIVCGTKRGSLIFWDTVNFPNKKKSQISPRFFSFERIVNAHKYEISIVTNWKAWVISCGTDMEIKFWNKRFNQILCQKQANVVMSLQFAHSFMITGDYHGTGRILDAKFGAVKLLLLARYFCPESPFHQDYLPRDIFKEIVQLL